MAFPCVKSWEGAYQQFLQPKLEALVLVLAVELLFSIQPVHVDHVGADETDEVVPGARHVTAELPSQHGDGVKRRR